MAIIPARGGSKRVPRKNIRPFLGKPILAYAIETALQSRLFSEVMVSTEDDEIAALALRYGATIPFRRSQRTADDHAGTAEVLLEVLAGYDARGTALNHACCIYPTAPFVTAALLARGWELFSSGAYDSVFPVVRFSSPIQRSLKLEGTRATMFWPEHYATRSQDLTPAYHDAGQFYWFDSAALKRKQRLWTDRSGALVISELEAHDIDSLEDWAIAECKYQWRATRG